MVDHTSKLELPGVYDAKKHKHCWHPYHTPTAAKDLPAGVDFCCGAVMGSCFHIRLCDPGAEGEEKNHGFAHPPCGYPSVVERLRHKKRDGQRVTVAPDWHEDRKSVV